MDYPVINFVKKVCGVLSGDGPFIFAFSLVFVCFTVFALSLSYGKRKSAWFSCGCFAVISACFITAFSAVSLIIALPIENFAFYFATLAVETVVLVLFIKLIAERREIKKEEKELVKYIDERINGEKKERVIEERIVASERTSSPPSEINFTHVKNVIGRLKDFDLSPSDQKQIDKLKEVLYAAENFGITVERKARINDGLAGLLKIMSKYGV